MILLIILLSLIMAFALLNLFADDENVNGGISICIFLFALMALVAFADFYHTTPKAIEVYQGKTTLQYTIVNGIVTDSTVVYKSE